MSDAVNEADLAVVSVLSGNRNFEGRINPDVKMNYLASPPLVVAYALAGSMDVDITTEPLGTDPDGEPVYLRDIWPSAAEVQDVIDASIAQRDVHPGLRRRVRRRRAVDGRCRPRPATRSPGTPSRPTCASRRTSTAWQREPAPVTDIAGARVLAKLGDSVTTDHISPAGAIKTDSPAGRYLAEHGVERRDFNSYGSRRGNHEVMIRGTFANIRLRNQLVPGVEGGMTRNLLTGEQTTIYDASVAYAGRRRAAGGAGRQGVRLGLLARLGGQGHRAARRAGGASPSRTSASTGPTSSAWASCRCSTRRARRAESLGLTGEETFDVVGVEAMNDGGDVPRTVTVRADGKEFQAVVRIDTPGEAAYYRHGGIMPYVLRSLL